MISKTVFFSIKVFFHIFDCKIEKSAFDRIATSISPGFDSIPTFIFENYNLQSDLTLL